MLEILSTSCKYKLLFQNGNRLETGTGTLTVGPFGLETGAGEGIRTLSGSNTLPCASISASFATSQEVSIRICDLLYDLLLRIPAATI
jgi:hypothetical protein